MLNNNPTGRVIVLAWPDTTARGDEMWMMLLKKAGLVKNLNFKVGHAALILVNDISGDLSYFDFGRYITARGMGRTRSALSDPKLKLNAKAIVEQNGNIANIHQIVEELDSIQEYTHGRGRMYFSVSDTISFDRAYIFAHSLVLKGSIPYGALAYNNNSCSRFVAQTVVAGLPKKHPAIRKLMFPESLMPSPISNVVNAQQNGKVFCFYKGVLEEFGMSRMQSLKFLIRQLTDNIRHETSRDLPDDVAIGTMLEPPRPTTLPHDAQWLGGIGEGAWYTLQHHNSSQLTITRFMMNAEPDYVVNCEADERLKIREPFHFAYDSHLLFTTLRQAGNVIRLHHA